MPVKVPVPYAPYIKIDQTILINLKTPQENFITPVELPTTEPATGQWVKTLAAADFPTVSPTNLLYAGVAYLGIVGRNTAAASRTIFWRMLKGGTAVATGSFSVPATHFYRIFAFWYGVAIGETLEMKLWAPVAGVNYDWTGFQIHPSRVGTNESLNSACYTELALSIAPVWSSAGAPGGAVTTGLFYPHHIDFTFAWLSVVTATYDIVFPKVVSKFGRISHGDWASADNILSATDANRTGLTQLRNRIPATIKLTIWKLW